MEIFPKEEVILDSELSFTKILLSFMKLNRLGSNVKVIIKDVIKPKVIIKPKSMTGLISLKTKDKKAIIVVKAV